MASTYAASSPSLPRSGPAQRAVVSPPVANQPAGTFLPGTKVQVGSQRVIIERYLSEGGFAHVYVVRIPRDGNKHDIAVLKRVAVPDRNHLASMRTEVETMKKLQGHKHVVTYMDSHASQLKGGGYEVFLLMEFCVGGGLIDFMNTRLQHRLTEPEILKIFSDVAEGVAAMHYLKPPLLHRDLKVENVLIGRTASGVPIYKLCDFGSAAAPRPAATTPEEGRLIEEDVQQHTTMQYRSPEMIDVWRKQPIDEKADIWALGVLLYKLCYYTTPFEDVGQMAILNATYKFPAYPKFSDRLKKLIAWMLKEQPVQRPNIYEVVKEVCSMRSADVPIKDIYSGRTASEARANQSLPSPNVSSSSSPRIGLQKSEPVTTTVSIPDIAPMRRGRPTSTQMTATAAKVGTAPVKSDPFAALDSKNFEVRAGAIDELSKRFPSLDDFSIAQSRGSNATFPQASTSSTTDAAKPSLSERVTQALADEAFGQANAKPVSVPVSAQKSLPSLPSKASPPKRSSLASSGANSQRPLSSVQQPAPVRPGVMYKSTAVGTSPPLAKKPELQPVSSRPIWKVPDSTLRSSSQPRASAEAERAARSLQPSLPPMQRPALLDMHRSKSQTATVSANLPTSSRPSLEQRRPSAVDVGELSISRTRSAQNRSRPPSMYVESDLDYLKDQEAARKRPSMEGRQHSKQASRQPSQERQVAASEGGINDDMDFLRSNEESEPAKGKTHRLAPGHHKKRSSLTGMLAGRFGDAFKRFEPGSSQERNSNEDALLTPDLRDDDHGQLGLSPILGSESTPTTRSIDRDSDVEESNELPADVKREMERQRLSEEERRVAEAAAEYRARVGTQGTGGGASNRASTIQARVQSLLDEGRQSPVSKRTAEGYGRFTDSPEPQNAGFARPPQQPPVVARKPAAVAEVSRNPFPRAKPAQLDAPAEIMTRPNQPLAVSPPTAAQPQAASRPSVPPKTATLRTGGSGRWPPTAEEERRDLALRPALSVGARSTGLAALLAKDLEGVPDYPSRGSSLEGAAQIPAGLSGLDAHDMEANFEKRYPNLTGIQMVETEIDGSMMTDDGRRMRIRDV